MTGWNVLATANMGHERYLLRFLNRYGEFKSSGFKEVVLGRVEDLSAFLEAIEALRRENPKRLRSLSRIIPLERTFQFGISDFMDKLKEAISPYIGMVENKKFYFRIKRRGHKGEISSQDVEREIGIFMFDVLEKAERKAEVSFENPDCIIIVETIGNRAGVGLITREMTEKYPDLVKVK